MKVLVLGNIILPIISQELSLPIANGGGWIGGICNSLMQKESIELGYCFHHSNDIMGNVGRLKYYAYTKKNAKAHCYDGSVEDKFRDILYDFKPDIVHIFGTEFPHTLAMVRAFGNPNRTVINIQGLCSICEHHYTGGLTALGQERSWLLDAARMLHIRHQQKQFAVRGKFEIEALKQVGHVIGRTDWDKACTEQINPQAQYHFCNETLRNEFYKHQWEYDECQKYSIFMSQAGYPIKGLHFMLEALPQILVRFPQAHLYIAGADITQTHSWKDKLKIGSYGSYIRRMLVKYSLQENVTFVGNLDEQQMCKQFMTSHVFVSPSTIENESNSVSEAKNMGVPVVASFVGGVTNRIVHGSDGFLYQHDAPYMLAHYVCRLFENDEMAQVISCIERENSQKLHNGSDNMNTLISIYQEIAKFKA